MLSADGARWPRASIRPLRRLSGAELEKSAAHHQARRIESQYTAASREAPNRPQGRRRNSIIRSHYQQLTERGKAKMTALVACMRKLLLILNAMIKNNSSWKTPSAS
jgi:hypothetical protein